MPYVPSPILLSFSYLVTGYVLYTSITRVAAVEARAVKVAEAAEAEALGAEVVWTAAESPCCAAPFVGGGSPVEEAELDAEGILQCSAAMLQAMAARE